MNAQSSLERLRDADPAANARPTLTVERLLAIVHSDDNDPLAGTRIAPHARHLRRRVVLVAAAAAAATLVPVLWPGSQSPIPATNVLAVQVDHDAVTVTIPLNQTVTVAMLQAELDQAHLAAKVIPATADCAEPAQGGLPVNDVFDAAPAVGEAQRVIFHPTKIPAGATLVFSLETHDGSTNAGWWLTNHPPNCVPPSITVGPVGGTDLSSGPPTTG